MIDPSSIPSISPSADGFRWRRLFVSHLWDRREWDTALLQVTWGFYVALPGNSFQAIGLPLTSQIELIIGLSLLVVGVLRFWAIYAEERRPVISKCVQRWISLVSIATWIGLSFLSLSRNPHSAQAVIYAWLCYRSLKSYMRHALFS